MHDEKTNSDGTKNSSEAPAEDAVLKEKNPNVTRDCFVRISAGEKLASDAVLAKDDTFVREKKSLKKKRKSYDYENFQAEQSDETPKKKQKKIMKELSDDDEEEDEDDFKTPKKTTPSKSPTKMKGKNEEEKEILKWWEEMDKKPEVTCLPEIGNPLKVLDIFSGAGGFSHGLDSAGQFETKWAIEWDESAAQAFKQNKPNASVFCEDCNVLMKIIKAADGKNEPAVYKNQILPKKGEVDVIVGGPPCQGFSRLNHFINGENSINKRLLVYSFLEVISISLYLTLNYFLSNSSFIIFRFYFSIANIICPNTLCLKMYRRVQNFRSQLILLVLWSTLDSKLILEFSKLDIMVRLNPGGDSYCWQLERNIRYQNYPTQVIFITTKKVLNHVF